MEAEPLNQMHWNQLGRLDHLAKETDAGVLICPTEMRRLSVARRLVAHYCKHTFERQSQEADDDCLFF